MSKIVDYIFSLDNNTKFISADFDFIYNQYEENETLINDSQFIINSLNDKKKRFIRITFPEDLFSISDNVAANSISSPESKYPEVLELSRQGDIDISKVRFFNKIDNINPKRNTFIVDSSPEVINKNLNYYSGKNRLNFSYTSSISLMLKEEEEESIKDSYLSKLIIKPKVANDIDNFDELRNYLKNDFRFKNSLESLNLGDLFPNIVILSSEVNTLSSNDLLNNNHNGEVCGILVEKFIKNIDSYEFLSSRFILINDQNISVIEDEAVAYGKTYKYVISYVYFYKTTANNNRFILNKFLICGSPFISNDIICKEEIPPPPPNNLRFFYNKNKKYLEIKWDEPTDYQDDAKGYQILKRKKIDEPFKIIAQLLGHSESDLYDPVEESSLELIIETPGEVKYSYKDYNYEPGVITIYTVRTIDAHGYFSNYSEQIAILWDPFEEKIIHDVISTSGARRNKPNSFVKSKTIFFDNEVNIVENLTFLKNVNKIDLYLTPDYVNLTLEDDVIPVLDEKYKFTILKLNDMTKFEKTFNIVNFNLDNE